MQNKQSLFASFKNDSVAGLIVFLIALPLCLGIAQASGAPLFSGIVAGVVGGVVIGALSKSHLSVSGPAAGLVAIVIGAITTLSPMGVDGTPDPVAGFQLFLCAVIISGVLQLLLGFLRAGSVANYFPTNVIEGMLAGIGLTIIFKQLPDAFGYVKPIGQAAGIEDGEGGVSLSEFLSIGNHIELGAVIIMLFGLGLLILWSTKFMKKLSFIPAGLLVVLTGTLLNILFKAIAPNLYVDGTHLVRLPVPASMSEFTGQFITPNFGGFTNPDVWQIGIVIAIVASIETLLCIEAADKLDPYKRYTSGDSELKAQGVGNIVSGLLGGLPITSVIVRSSANINAGAKTKISAIVHGVLLFVCVASIPSILNMIPKASLAAILIFTGYRLCRPAVFKHMWHSGLEQFIPFVITALAVALPMLGLLKGVGIGIGLSIFFLLRNNMRNSYYYQRTSYANDDLIKIELSEEVSFLNKGSIKTTLDNIPVGSHLIIDAQKTAYIDFDVLQLIREFAGDRAPEKNIKVSLVGFKNIYKLPEVNSETELIASLSGLDEKPNRTKGNSTKLIKNLKQ